MSEEEVEEDHPLEEWMKEFFARRCGHRNVKPLIYYLVNEDDLAYDISIIKETK